MESFPGRERPEERFDHLAAQLHRAYVSINNSKVEWVSGLIATAWGMIFLMPWDTFGQNAVYQAFVLIGFPEDLLGLLFFTLGMAQIFALLGRHLLARKIVCLLIGCLWMFVSLEYVFANPQVTHWVTPFVLSVANYTTAIEIYRPKDR